MADKVKQTMFETSRVLEYFTERELSYQTGHTSDGIDFSTAKGADTAPTHEVRGEREMIWS